MELNQIDPIRDLRWAGFLERQRHAAIFHSSGWLAALSRTYGYKPVVLTMAKPGEPLTSGVVMIRIASWLTGHRIVSVPFSDHCQPLADTPRELHHLLSAILRGLPTGRTQYIEIRPSRSLNDIPPGFTASDRFCLHTLDLRRDTEQIWATFHKDCIQRKVRRAEREGLIYEVGNSESFVTRFYELVVLTRQKQRLLPQPREWFRQLVHCLGDHVQIHLAARNGRVVAGMLTLRFGRTLVYKYGGSDPDSNKFGGMPMLFWKVIQKARTAGLCSLDLGRSDCDNRGLIEFKDRLGAIRTEMTYLRSGQNVDQDTTSGSFRQIAGSIVSWMPKKCLPLAGRLIYRHYA